MDVAITDEQAMLVDLAAGVAAEAAGRWALGRAPSDAAGATDGRDVKLVAEAGLYGLRHGDVDLQARWTDVCLVAEQFGRHLAPVPFLGPVLALEALQYAGADDELIAEVASGQRLMTMAVTADLTAFAGPADDALAWDAAGVSSALVLAPRMLAHHGVERSVPTVDFTRSTATLSTTSQDCAATSGITDEARDRLTAMAMTAVAADLLGIMGAALDSAVEHAKIRRQFGVAIGSFQAVQHLLADALVSVEATRSAVWYAGWAVETLAVGDALQAARTAKAFASSVGVEVVEAAMQVFGGMSQTWESPCHLWLRRVRLDRQLFGDEQVQFDALASAETGNGVR
ncbi:acyl-CoA dehydrogenase family protein [Mycobacterium sp. 94-17]|uniref:acyl-CoA dehydrogenase family protein n=1 Tax=Mycobacterium sp. 94-17 TaxID=2986147 RepID=UPI002D1EF96C|nr:acyl-CoA dehydrogenase family protein [Mycobacterium sp. 94-17]MEB4209747.1 acyl-CoA dehydrogenase family protein [Mycobacterium sp. 94-17]